ncbi:YIP1 family protein [Nocardiopsis sp. CC223A]|uniref:YIP1 family protein n=1 Tax=Nocardiopsis sp. CC223A TaxID=3044051 RepID=UPI002795B106|nr:YIP1 family protein [Nocardiopsis sp. CC223A]
MLRHLLGLLVGIALAPLLWISVSWSAGELPGLSEGDVAVATVAAAVLLVLVGFACAYLAAARISPLTAGAAGLPLSVLALWPAVHPASLASAMSWLDPEGFVYPGGPGVSVALPLGALLLFSATLPGRWRRPVAATGPAMVAAPWERVHGPREELPEPPVGDTVPEVPGRRAATEVWEPREGDPAGTTTPFARGEDGWTPLGGESERRD